MPSQPSRQTGSTRHAAPEPTGPGSDSGSGFGDFFRHHGWFSPGVRLFRRISFTAKACRVGVAFVIPLVVTLAFLANAASEQIVAMKSERAGVAWVKPVLALVSLAQNRRRAATDNAPDLAELQDSIKAAFAAVRTRQEESGKAFASGNP